MPDRIFLDKRCTERFPIPFPDSKRRAIFRIVVAMGATSTCRTHFPDSFGTLRITPSVRAREHWAEEATTAKPFEIGDVDPTGDFVHVFDEHGLELAMGEFDTIRDFVGYLEKRSQFIRSGKLLTAMGEENLLAYYAVRTNSEGVHDFVIASDETLIPMTIDDTHFRRLRVNLQFAAKKNADRISYVWDDCIRSFTVHVLAGTTIARDGFEVNLKQAEQCIRLMALERRYIRRTLGEALVTAMQSCSEEICFRRAVIPDPGQKENKTGFFVQAWKYPAHFDEMGGYEAFRTLRARIARVVAFGLLEQNPHLKQIVGVVIEPPEQGVFSSEDLIYARQEDWTDKERRDIRNDCEAFNVLTDKMRFTPFRANEYPEGF